MSYITGLALVKNDVQFLNTGLSVGSIEQIITPDLGGRIDGDYWAIPVNYGVYAGWRFQPYNPSNPLENVAPLFAVAVTKVSAINTSDWWYILGTSTQFVTAANGGTALPIVWPQVSHTVPELPVCTVIDGLNASNNNTLTIGVPTLAFGQNYFPFGFLNGVALAAATSGGYADLTALLVFLNASWSSVGTWTKTADNLTLIATQAPGSGTDVFCGGILAVSPSL